MKNSAKTKEIKIKPKRVTRAERKSAERAQKASEQLKLCRQAGEFHKAYLEVELEYETAKYEALQARIAELQPTTEERIETFETIETTEEMEAFDELAIPSEEEAGKAQLVF